MQADQAVIAQLVDILAQAAKTEILPRFRALELTDIEEKTSTLDLVTVADKAAERQITERLSVCFPDWQVLGEEAVAECPGLLEQLKSSGTTAILDPIDGTWNYAHGSSVFGVILALVVDGQTTAGLLYDPIHHDWIYAIAGQGAYYVQPDRTTRRLLLKQNSAKAIADMIGCIPFHHVSNVAQQRLVANAMLDFRRITNIGCSCHEYRMLSTGAFDFSVSAALLPWDHAAGELIYREAGGCSGLLTGEVYSPAMTEGHLLLAPNQQAWDQLQQRLAPAFL